jgi:hypothetical protein
MRRVLMAGFAAGLIAPAAAWGQEVPARLTEEPPGVADAIPPGSDAARDLPDRTPDGPQPGDPAPPPPPPGPPRSPQPGDPAPPPTPRAEAKPAEKPKLAETVGGVAGSALGSVVGTAAGGPAGGIAGSWAGGAVGTHAVKAAKRVLGVGGKTKPAEPPVERAAAPQAGRDAAAEEPAPPAAAEPPGPSGPTLVEEPPATRSGAPS